MWNGSFGLRNLARTQTENRNRVIKKKPPNYLIERPNSRVVTRRFGGGETYTVKAGDTLSKISKQQYGDANEYIGIFYANRDKLKDPDKIQVGQQLTIPARS